MPNNVPKGGQQSPRSPIGAAGLQEHLQPRTAQIQQVQLQAQIARAQYVQAQGTSAQRSSTPPAPSAAGPNVPSRVTSPAGTPTSQLQPARAASAPRVTVVTQHHVPAGSNLRTSSQPMPAHQNRHLQSQQQLRPGTPPFFGPCVTPGTQPQAFPPSAMAGVPLAAGRASIGHPQAAHQRTASPMGMGGAASPAGNLHVVGAQQPYNMASARGRSPAPGMTQAPVVVPPAMRAPRAVTPNSLVKGITQPQGMPCGVMNRSSFGVATPLHARGMM